MNAENKFELLIPNQKILKSEIQKLMQQKKEDPPPRQSLAKVWTDHINIFNPDEKVRHWSLSKVCAVKSDFEFF